MNKDFKVILEMKTNEKCCGTMSMSPEQIVMTLQKVLCFKAEQSPSMFSLLAVMVDGCYSCVILLVGYNCLDMLIIVLGKHHTRSVLIMLAVIAEHPLTIYSHTVERW